MNHNILVGHTNSDLTELSIELLEDILEAANIHLEDGEECAHDDDIEDLAVRIEGELNSRPDYDTEH